MSNIIILKQPQETIASRCGKQLSKIDQPISGQTNIAEQIAAPIRGPMDVAMVANLISPLVDGMERIITLSRATPGPAEERRDQCFAIAVNTMNEVDRRIAGKNFQDIKTRRIKELEEALAVIHEAAGHLATAFKWEEQAPISLVRIENAAANALAKGRVK